MKKTMERIFLGGLILLLPASGFACSMGQWNGGSVGASTIVGTPITNPAVPRYSESCGLQVTAPTAGHVQDNSPDGHTKFIARFYVRPNLTGAGSSDLFVAYDSESPGASPANQLMKVSYDGTNLHFHATGASLKSVNAPKAFWHLVEIEYNAAGISRFWVNSDAVVNLNNPTDTFPTPGAGAVTAVRLGLPNGAANFTGVAQFDSYESHSTTPVGPLIVCDANDSKGGVPVNTLDVVAILDERYQQILAKGQPDCNFDGAVNTLDVVKALEIRYGN